MSRPIDRGGESTSATTTGVGVWERGRRALGRLSLRTGWTQADINSRGGGVTTPSPGGFVTSPSSISGGNNNNGW